METEYDYVVVGSGAGGGPVAANLAEAGKRVLLLEAGGDWAGHNYDVPCFHAYASEQEEMRWDFFVRHYDDDVQQQRDSKFRADRNGVLYPRAGTLGGCTAHNAMILVYPHNADWDRLAQLTGDQSWASGSMRKYFERLERCNYVDRPGQLPRNRLLAALVRALPFVSWRFFNRSRHGYDGWLSTQVADPKLVIHDVDLLKIIKEGAESALAEFFDRPLTLLEGVDTFFDPNDWRVVATNPEGIWFVPLATLGGKRNGSRERIRSVQSRFPQNLVVRTNALVTRVLLDENQTAIGVEYLDRPHAYRADPVADGSDEAVPSRAMVTREVILAAGTFNSPQLLKLSGLGPREELEQFGIRVRVDLPGVGANLQDRYEVGVITEMKREFALLEGATFEAPVLGADPDPCWVQWESGKGVYTTNGAVLAVIRKSRPSEPLPDLFIFGLPATFKGYYPGYSKELARSKSAFTWVILKAHTRNNAGRVRLRSADPRDVPDINFHYFHEGSDHTNDDLEAVVEGVKFVRRVMNEASSITNGEVLPGDSVRTVDDIRQFVKDQAWGHHASGTCKMGAEGDPMAVVDSRFRVRGTHNLRVVDASVFPYIPGFFIVSAVYMVAEKASDVILADAKDHMARVRGAVRRVAAPAESKGVQPAPSLT